MFTASARAGRFSYGPYEIDEGAGILCCRYRLDHLEFCETFTFGPGLDWSGPAREAARLVHLLAGVSYYKAGAPPVVDLGEVPTRAGEREFLQRYFVGGLGEFAYRSGLDLGDLKVTGGGPGFPPPPAVSPERGPLVPFGGGIDSIVVTEIVRSVRVDPALFVVERPGVRFAAIEAAAAETGLAVIRAEREIDPRLIRLGREASVLNGHVPVTAIISAVAVTAAAASGRSEVIMSNEWSASRGNTVAAGQMVNHQWSKSWDFEQQFRSVLAGCVPGVEWFSLLRPWSELWVARRFAALGRYHRVVHSCNRAFYLDPAARLDRWCGECDKCCFIDLILSPFMSQEQLEAVFDGCEPLQNPSLLPKFAVLVGASEGLKPWECVGDVVECAAAAAMAYGRPDRRGNAILAELAHPAAATTDLMEPQGKHAVPADLFTASLG